MSILPISSIKFNNSYNLSFTQKNKENENNNNLYKSNDFVTIPASLFIALATMSLPSEVVAENDFSDKTEIIENLQSQNIAVTPYKPNSTLVQYKKHFSMNNEGYTMYFTDIMKNSRLNDEKNVTDIFFVKDGFQLISRGFDDLNSPIKFLKLVHHDMRKEHHKDFWGAIVREKVCTSNGENPREITSEIVLPDEIAKELIQLFSKSTPFKYNYANSSYIRVSGPSLKKPEIKHYFY